MKTIAALQPGYLPWVGFFDLMKRSDLFVIEDNLKYTKQDWRNRNRIRTASGARYLTVPVRLPAEHLPINQVMIDNSTDWSRRHWNVLYENYHAAPYWSRYAALLSETYKRTWERLIDLDLHLIDFLRSEFQITTPIVLLSSLPVAFGKDKTQSLIDLVKAVGGHALLEGASGRRFIDEARFVQAGLDIRFQDYVCKPYRQQFQPFLSHLSAIDLLLNEGPAGTEFI